MSCGVKENFYIKFTCHTTNGTRSIKEPEKGRTGTGSRLCPQHPYPVPALLAYWPLGLAFLQSWLAANQTK